MTFYQTPSDDERDRSPRGGKWKWLSWLHYLMGGAGVVCLLVAWYTHDCYVGRIVRDGEVLTSWCDPYNIPLIVAGAVLVAIGGILWLILRQMGVDPDAETS